MRTKVDVWEGEMAIDSRIYTDTANAAMLRETARKLFEESGATPQSLARAFSERTAAAHEAGHAVVYAHEGEPVEEVRIFRAVPRRMWRGVTIAGSGWKVDGETPTPKALQQARFQVAGWCGEWLTIGDDARGSSIDELAVALNICALVVYREGGDPATLMAKTVEKVCGILRVHAAVHTRLASELLRTHRVRGVKLDKILEPAKKNPD